MAEPRECEFFLVRYVPDPVKNEFVNVGVMLREAHGGGAADRAGATEVRFTRNWARARCIDPEVDVGMLEGLESEIRRRLSEAEPDVPPMMSLIGDTFSNLVQVTQADYCLADSMAAKMEQLMELYVEPRKRHAVERRSVGRQAIYGQMRSQFERAGVWDLMRKRIAAANYTRPGDPLRIDCGYRPNGVVRMFHAVTLEGDLEMAKVLAFSMAAIREGVMRREGAGLELTAIVEPLMEVRGGQEEGDRTAQYRFGVESMEGQDIRVLTTSDLPRIAEAVRIDLRV